MIPTFSKTGLSWLLLLMVGSVLSLAACEDRSSVHDEDHGHGHEEEAGDYARGPHNGRLLEDGQFALEITIFEAGQPPHFRVYPYMKGKPIDPAEVNMQIDLLRLGNITDVNTFVPEGDHLTGQDVVVEPHSFDVVVKAQHAGKAMTWQFESYEGRSVISDEQAEKSGLETGITGPAVIAETVDVMGRVDFAPNALTTLRARYPGKVLIVTRNAGDAVKAGDVLARIESNDTLRAYAITAPMDGVVVERNANAGDITTDTPLFLIGDLSRLQVDFHVFASDLDQVQPGQEVTVLSVTGTATQLAKIDTFLPTKESATQTIIARSALANDDGQWIPGMTVKGLVVVNREEVPLAVRTEALQRFRDFQVVFAKIGETYEVRMLDLGRQTEEWTEVLGGIEGGQEYVTVNSFLIKADVEKDGASHDH